MGAVRLLVGSELRRRWRSLAVTALLVGLTGAVMLAALGGARRTSSSFDRFLESTRSHDVLVFAQDIGRPDVERLRSLRGVAAVGYARQLALVRPDGDFLAVGGALDDALFRDVYRLRVVEGRAPAADAPQEVVIGEPLARSSGLGPGDTVRLQSFTQDQVDQLDPNATELPAPSGPEVTLRVVGVSRSPIDLSLQGADGGLLLLSRSFVDEYGSAIGNFSGPTGGVLLVRLTDGEAGVPRFLDDLRRVLGERTFDVDPVALSVGGIQDSIDLLAFGVLAFGVIAGIAGLSALGLIIGRQAALLGAGQAAVRDLGLPRSMRTIAIAGPLLLAASAGVLAAVLGAWAASALMPFGVAGRAEPDPGLHFDALVLVAGGLALAAALGAVASVAAWRAARAGRSDEQAHRRQSVLARVLEGAGLAPVATIGVGLALEPGRGRTAAPVRSSLVGAALVVLTVTAVVVFASSLDHLVESPHAYGINWDARVTDSQARPEREGHRCGRVDTRLSNNPDIDEIANVCSLSITLGGRAIGALGFTSLQGSVQPTVLEGRSPQDADEVAVGSQTLDALGSGIGARVTGQSPAGTVDYLIVGRVVVPSLGDPQAVADGAVFTGEGLDRLDIAEDVSGTSALVVRFRPGVDHAAAADAIARLPGVGDLGTSGVVLPPVPLDVERLEQLDRLPIVLVGFLAILGAVAVGILLVTSVQRRRRDLAVLRSIGFRRSQLYATVWVQATTVAFTGLVVGLVVGTAAGSVLWVMAAAGVGLLPEVDVPAAALAGVALTTLVIANGVAAFPARAAARERPAAALHSE